MIRRQGQYNPKRRILDASTANNDPPLNVSYGGNAEHKLRPGDYGLGRPPNPRPMKTLCDGKGPFPKAMAEALLHAGAAKGMISRQIRNGWPQNIWAVSDDGEPFEAQLENPECGVYHGYPMPEDDDFRTVVMKEWANR